MEGLAQELRRLRSQSRNTVENAHVTETKDQHDEAAVAEDDNSGDDKETESTGESSIESCSHRRHFRRPRPRKNEKNTTTFTLQRLPSPTQQHHLKKTQTSTTTPWIGYDHPP